MKKAKLLIGGFLIASLALCACTTLGKEVENKSKYSIFSWEDEVVYKKERKVLLEVLEEMNIHTVYQSFSEELINSSETKSFLSKMYKEDIDIYYLTGDPQWAKEEDAFSLKQEIEKVALINEKMKENRGFKGIVVDVEPYLMEEWKEGSKEERAKLNKKFVDGLTEAYQWAKDKDIKFLVCIPHFYEKYSLEEMERLISKACDGITVMNYDRSDEYTQIENEVTLAKKYDKEIVCIYELQKPGYHDLEDIHTYYNAGLDELKNSWKNLEESFKYPKLSFSYHYYNPLKEILDISKE